ncbi:hypothetical protein ZIOFF_001460 [Zingiber officinale]|uniref:Regulatory protein RecX n=1 Tax=Zingiber officinale TaxID=94328 RepID=A0A8J5I3A0_ZINOF|nr:hypothetical protein ZIOFF_001460 [Zingiber officinale]
MITTSSRTQVNNVELMQNHYKVAPAQQRKCCAMCGGPDHHSRVRRSMCLFFLLLLSLFYLVDSMECALDNNFEVSLVEAQDSSVMTNSETVMERPIKQEAEQMAIELLAARAFTTLELRKKLRGKRYPKDVVAAVISSAKERGLLNDGLYAESFSRSRWLSSTWGPKRIKWVLVQKGVSEMEVDTATRQVFQEDDSGDKSRSTQHGISEPAFKRLYVKATKQWLQGQSSSLENRKARIVRWLQYRGFSWGVTNIILRKLLSDQIRQMSAGFFNCCPMSEEYRLLDEGSKRSKNNAKKPTSKTFQLSQGVVPICTACVELEEKSQRPPRVLMPTGTTRDRHMGIWDLEATMEHKVLGTWSWNKEHALLVFHDMACFYDQERR